MILNVYGNKKLVGVLKPQIKVNQQKNYSSIDGKVEEMEIDTSKEYESSQYKVEKAE